MPEPSTDPSEPTELDPATAEVGETWPGSTGGEVTETVASPSHDSQGGEPTLSLGSEPTEVIPAKSGEIGGEPTVDLPTELSGSHRPDPQPGPTIRTLGDYELLDVLGKGGMGIVYRARQISLNRIVAVKLIRLDKDFGGTELRRFQHEAEVIASLDHPGIVPIYEVGEHDGCHYFSMKVIVGQSLQKANPKLRRDFRAIAGIVAGSARAVQHAHERGVLHRDLKPSNILLDSSQSPHVCDFGLAKRFSADDDELTRVGGIVGSPGYMAPEQATAAQGTITIATDVYGLGSVLYALLSGHAPHRGSSTLEVLDAVREHPPELPSQDDPAIPRDLEVICMKCLERDQVRRYHSAEDLADDLDRWLEGRPITARKVSPGARLMMWSRRKPLVAGLAAALLISVFLGSTGILVNWLQVRHQRDLLTAKNAELARANVRIRSEWETSRSLNEFLVGDLLALSSPFVAGRRDLPVSALLDRSAALASSRFAQRPKIEGSIRQTLGSAYLALGMHAKAEAELLRSARLRETLPEEDELDRLSTELALAALRLAQGQYDKAEAHALKAYEGRKRRLGDDDETTLEAATILGALLKLKGRAEDARKHLQETADLARKSLGNEHRTTILARTILATILYDLGRYDEASASLEELARVSARAFGQDHPATLQVRSMLGASLVELRQEAKAEEILTAALGPAREVFGLEHPETIRIQTNLAATQARQGKFREAGQGMAETPKAPLLSDDPETLKKETNRAIILLNQGKLTDGEALLRGLVPRMRQRFGPDQRELADFLILWANALRDSNKLTEAETVNGEAIVILDKSVPGDHPLMANAQALQVALLLANGKPAEAEPLARRVLELRSKPGANTPPSRLGSIKRLLGASLADQKKYAEAEPFLLDGLRLMESDRSATPAHVADCRDRLIRLYEAWGKPDKAAEWRTHPVVTPGS